MTIGSGTCGSSATWRLEDDGTLYIEGTGAMEDYENNNGSPWYSNKSSIARVIISEGITHLGVYSFYNIGSSSNMYASPSYIKIPDSVTSIGAYSMKQAIVSLILVGKGVDELGSECLYDTSYDKVVIFEGDKPSVIGSGVIYNRTTVISNGWASRSVFTNISISYSYLFRTYELGENSSWELDLDNLTVTIIGSGATEDFDSNSRFFSKLCNICNTVIIGDEITSIGDYTFSSSYVEHVRGGIGLRKVGIYSFNSGRLTTFEHLELLTEIGDYAFRNTDLENLDLRNATSIGQYAFDGANLATRLVLCEHLEEIGAYAFYGCSKLSNLKIPDSVTTVGESAFSVCGIRCISFGNSISSIGANAFVSCTSLRFIDFRGQKPTLGATCFRNTSTDILCVSPGWANQSVFSSVAVNSSGTAYTTWIFKGDHKIGEDAVWVYDLLSQIMIVSGSGNTFDYEVDNTNSKKFLFGSIPIRKIVIQDGIIGLGNYLFYCSDPNAINLRHISLPSTLKEIGDNTFSNRCKYMDNIHLPEGLEKIGINAFSDNAFDRLIIPSTLKEIGSSAFSQTANYFRKSIIVIHRGNPTSVPDLGIKLSSGHVWYLCSAQEEFGGGENMNLFSETMFNTVYPVMVKVENGWKIISNQYIYDKT